MLSILYRSRTGILLFALIRRRFLDSKYSIFENSQEILELFLLDVKLDPMKESRNV